MAVETARKLLLSFNRGVVSALGLARIDLNRMGMSAEIQTNWMPRVLGSMRLRPGLKYLSATKDNNKARKLPFVFSVDDLAQPEITDSVMRVRVSDAIIARVAVTASVTNGNFTSNVNDWTDSDETGGLSFWLTGGYLWLRGDGTDSAIRRQQVTVTETGTEHALRVIIERGPVALRIGSTAGGEEYIT